MDRHKLAALFLEMAELLMLHGESPFKVRAYTNASRRLNETELDLEKLIQSHSLSSIEGIGKGLEEKIEKLYLDGTFPELEALKKQTPSGLLDMLQISGLGPKKVRLLYKTLGVDSIKELKRACHEKKVEHLRGFGLKSQTRILEAINQFTTWNKRHLWWEGHQVLIPLLKAVKQIPGVEKAEGAGSYRRKLETIGDLDIVVQAKNPKEVIDAFCKGPYVKKIVAHGSTKATILHNSSIHIDLRVVNEKQYPFALLYFTGSRDHTIHLRQMAKKMDLKLNEYELKGYSGLKSEREIYKALGVHYVEPELRENAGEFEVEKLPKLLSDRDIKGTFHCHTTFSDGRNTIQEMAAYADGLGWEYLGISDHSKSSVWANGLNEERLLEEVEAIKKLNHSKGFKVHLFAGTECDILKDGSLDYSNDILKSLDFVVVSLHQSMGHSKDVITKRLISAIENPYSTFVGHLTGRLLLKREGYEVDAEKVIDAAIANGKAIEINGNPYRMEMDWRLWHRAKEKGLKTVVTPDAHEKSGLLFVYTGVNVARKGWLEKEDVLNTLNLNEIKGYLHRGH